MEVTLKPGTYVVGVSGGVDSIVLLHALTKLPDVMIIVAHYDHGIRDDSTYDCQLVATTSQKYNLDFEFMEGNLGRGASEEQAREARYAFLRQIRDKYNAAAIVTAHHQDDALETAAFNVLRGTKRKGMSSLQSTEDVIRPLMPYNKADIRKYADSQGLVWHEDSTNHDEKYARNWIRRSLLPRLTRNQKRQLEAAHAAARGRNNEVDEAVAAQLRELETGEGLDRQKFIALPYSVAAEVMVAWLRQQGVKDVDSKLIDVLVVSVKTLPPGKRISVGKNVFLNLRPTTMTLG